VKKVSKVLVILFWLIGLCSEYVGLYHTYKRHSTKQFTLAILIPPYAIYNTFEIYWHQEDTNWNIVLRNDCIDFNNIISLVHSDSRNINEIELAATKMNQKISTYPTDKRVLLKQEAEIYLKYISFSDADFVESVDKFLALNILDLKYLDSTLYYRNILENRYNLSEITRGYDSLLSETLIGLSKIKDDDLYRFKVNWLKKSTTDLKKVRIAKQLIFYKIFSIN
jgi:hypothetical protein